MWLENKDFADSFRLYNLLRIILNNYVCWKGTPVSWKNSSSGFFFVKTPVVCYSSIFIKDFIFLVLVLTRSRSIWQKVCFFFQDSRWLVFKILVGLIVQIPLRWFCRGSRTAESADRVLPHWSCRFLTKIFLFYDSRLN